MDSERNVTRFQLEKIKYIFADMKITNRLLEDLCISDTCTLRGDTWHLMNEVWPKRINFGNHFSSIKNHLLTMLTSPHESDWDEAFHKA